MNALSGGLSGLLPKPYTGQRPTELSTAAPAILSSPLSPHILAVGSASLAVLCRAQGTVDAMKSPPVAQPALAPVLHAAGYPNRHAPHPCFAVSASPSFCPSEQRGVSTL